jgi:chorismate dehydratase
MWDFDHADMGKAFNITYTVPSQCALELQQGAADVGIIPSAAYGSIPDLSVLPGVAIASKQAVRSILLVSRKPIDQIRSVALDNSSLTSVALTRILFERLWGSAPSFTSLPPDLENMLTAHDAALLIGDPALKIDRTKYKTWDLAEEWIRFTGKPFVFAFWAVTSGAVAASNIDLAAVFQESRDHGLRPESVAEISRVWAPRIGLAESAIQQYLTSSIYYYLDEACLDGLRLFYQLAAECRILPAAPKLRFAGPRPVLI